jgi:hypothetical protein
MFGVFQNRNSDAYDRWRGMRSPCRPGFKFLADATISRSPPPPNDAITIMTRFRRSLSFGWLSQIPHSSRVPYVASSIRVFLKCTESTDATVRIISYSTLGGLLLSVAPFRPITFYRAREQSIQTFNPDQEYVCIFDSLYLCL